jgi:flavin reductase (DIM6/NTAB) family NADH-FMN oxidoreductase RutF
MDKKAFNKLSYGVYILSTLTADGKPTGCTVNSAVQVNSVEPTIAVALNKDSYTLECIRATNRFALSVLSEQSLPISIGKMGYFSGRDTDKFADVPHREQDGLEVISDACATFTCSVVDSTDVGTHILLIGKVDTAKLINAEEPMTYNYYHKIIKGKTPSGAPTFNE